MFVGKPDILRDAIQLSRYKQVSSHKSYVERMMGWRAAASRPSQCK
jgi:hypothetical protein